MTRVLGVDAGFANFGFAVMEFDGPWDRLIAMGVIRTQKGEKKRMVLASDDNVRRARLISSELAKLFVAHSIRGVCAEAMSYPRSSSVAAKMAMAFGVVASLAESFGLPIVQASPKEIKKLVVGIGSASKEDVMIAVNARFSEAAKLVTGLPKSLHEHAYDAAAAVAACAGSDVMLAIRGSR